MWTGDNGDQDPIDEVKEAKSYFDNLFNAVGIHQEPVQNN